MIVTAASTLRSATGVMGIASRRAMSTSTVML